MPSRWWIPVHGCQPPVKLEHLHAVVSQWFDTDETHRAHNKVFSLSPMGTGPGGTPGFQLGLCADWAATQLIERLAEGSTERLGSQYGWLTHPEPLDHDTWPDLLDSAGPNRWQLRFDTPVTFRTGNRATPLPTVAAILRGLMDQWNAYAPTPIKLSRPEFDAVWVDDLDLTTERIRFQGRTYPGSVGSMRFACGDADVADQVAPLFRLAPYTGVGSGRSKGLGVTSLIEESRQRPGAER